MRDGFYWVKFSDHAEWTLAWFDGLWNHIGRHEGLTEVPVEIGSRVIDPNEQDT